MKARLTEQYDLVLGKREMDELMLALRLYTREFAASPLCEELLAGLEEVYTGGGAGFGVAAPGDDTDEEGGAAVPSGEES